MRGPRDQQSHASDRHGRPAPEQIRTAQEAADAQAGEVLTHIYQAVLRTPEFTLGNGTKCRVDPFYEPEVNAGGDLKCGFDVQMADGTQLEFTVGHTGWGKSFVMAEEQRAKHRGSARQP
jgi:hypothetical protein